MNIQKTIKDINSLINEKVSKREKMYLIGGGIFAVAFIFLLVVVMPLAKYNAKIEKNINVKERELKKIYEIGAKIKAIEAANKLNEADRGDFKLFGYLEDLAEKQNIKNLIEYMKPVPSTDNERETVEVRIRGLYEESLVGFLYGIDTSPTPLKVKKFTLKRSEKDKNLDVTFQVQING